MGAESRMGRSLGKSPFSRFGISHISAADRGVREWRTRGSAEEHFYRGAGVLV